MNRERRRFTRVPFNVTAEMIVNNRTFRAEHIRNLSMGGCLLPLNHDMEKGTPCVVEITLSGTKEKLNVRVEGEISRSDSGGVAVRFDRIDPDSLFHLRNIVRYNSLNSDLIEQEMEGYLGLS